MVAFPKPRFQYDFNVATELAALRSYERTKPGRDIPDKEAGKLLLATWNIANLGVQKREDKHYRLIAQMIRRFDLIALQEVNDDLTGLREVERRLPNYYKLLFSDAAGNRERLAFVYDGRKVKPKEKVGEIAIPQSDAKNIKLPGIRKKFAGFDRHPYLASFQVGSFDFVVVNVHLYFGHDSKRASINRRCLEAFAVARWAHLRRRSKYAYDRDIIALGDFNLPKKDPQNPVFTALTRRGLTLMDHSTEVASNIKDDKHYDQIAFFPRTMQHFTGKSGVFDFDGALFADLWSARGKKAFLAYMRYYISDHRIMWAQFRTT